MLDKIKNYFIGFLAILSGVLYALFRVQARKTTQAKVELGKALYEKTITENKIQYEEKRSTAAELVNDYQRARAEYYARNPTE